MKVVKEDTLFKIVCLMVSFFFLGMYGYAYWYIFNEVKLWLLLVSFLFVCQLQLWLLRFGNDVSIAHAMKG